MLVEVFVEVAFLSSPFRHPFFRTLDLRELLPIEFVLGFFTVPSDYTIVVLVVLLTHQQIHPAPGYCWV